VPVRVHSNLIEFEPSGIGGDEISNQLFPKLLEVTSAEPKFSRHNQKYKIF
jgi:hypothetical protein